LTGTQGVIMPHTNVEDLMLREEILDAVASKKFHIWPVARIEDGIEVLTGAAAGKRGEDGTFEKGTVFALVDERLSSMAATMKEFQ